MYWLRLKRKRTFHKTPSSWQDLRSGEKQVIVDELIQDNERFLVTIQKVYYLASLILMWNVIEIILRLWSKKI